MRTAHDSRARKFLLSYLRLALAEHESAIAWVADAYFASPEPDLLDYAMMDGGHVNGYRRGRREAFAMEVGAPASHVGRAKARQKRKSQRKARKAGRS